MSIMESLQSELKNDLYDVAVEGYLVEDEEFEFAIESITNKYRTSEFDINEAVVDILVSGDYDDKLMNVSMEEFIIAVESASEYLIKEAEDEDFDPALELDDDIVDDEMEELDDEDDDVVDQEFDDLDDDLDDDECDDEECDDDDLDSLMEAVLGL